jgi:hypothetical protein
MVTATGAEMEMATGAEMVKVPEEPASRLSASAQPEAAYIANTTNDPLN